VNKYREGKTNKIKDLGKSESQQAVEAEKATMYLLYNGPASLDLIVYLIL